MANKKQEETEIEVFDNMDNALNVGEAFLEKNQSKILIGLAVVAALVIAVVCYKSFYSAPREASAKESIFEAEKMFARDSFQLALDGNADMMGFLDVIDEYGSTEAGNLAKGYAGLCYKQLGDNEKAVEYLESFSADGKIVKPAIYGAIGDAYWDLNKADKALSYYKRAASTDNEMVTPFYKKRAALLLLSQNENEKALSLLESIVKDYPNYQDLAEVKKYIEFAK